MSWENVEVVRRAIEVWNAGDMDRLRELYDPDVIVRALPGWPEPGPFVGRDAVMREFRHLRDAFDEDSLQLKSGFATIGDQVIVRCAWRMMGRGPEGNMELTLRYRVRRGLLLDLEFFWDHDEALEAAGRSE